MSRIQLRTVPAKPVDRSSQDADELTKFAGALSGNPVANTGTGAAGVPAGPVVRVARGNNVTYVPVGAR